MKIRKNKGVGDTLNGHQKKTICLPLTEIAAQCPPNPQPIGPPGRDLLISLVPRMVAVGDLKKTQVIKYTLLAHSFCDNTRPLAYNLPQSIIFMSVRYLALSKSWTKCTFSPSENKAIY